MLVYVFVYLISLVFAYYARKNSEECKSGIVYLILSILPPLIFATVRDVSVGTDVVLYQVQFFNLASSFNNPLAYMASITANHDYGYQMLVYIIAKVFKSIHVLFFIEELIILVSVYYVLWYYRERVSFEYSLMLFYFLFYPDTFNTVRQEIAMAFFLVATIFMEKYEIRKMTIMMILAILFHISAVITIPLVILYYYINSEKRRNVKNFILIIVAGITLFISYNYMPLAIWVMGKVSLFPRRWIGFLNSTKNNFQTIAFLLCLMLIIILHHAKKIHISNLKWINWMLYLNFIYLCGFYFVSKVDFGERMYTYIRYFWVIAFGEGVYIFKNNSQNRILYTMLSAALFGSWSYYLYFVRNVAGVASYRLM